MHGASNLSRIRKITFAVAMPMLVLGASELVLRLAGALPIDVTRPPPVQPHITEHPTLGYTLRPGSVEASRQAGSWVRTFRVTADAHGRRITHPPRDPREPAREQIWIFGCSMTMGSLLNDEETFPWIVQELLPEYEVVNFGVGSYSTLHSLIQLEDALKEPARPKTVVLAYEDFHDARNVLARGWRQSVRARFRRPFARFGSDGRLHRGMMDPGHDLLPLADRSVLVAAIDRILGRLDERRLRAREVSRMLIGEMLALCRREGIRFVIANHSGNVADLLAYFRKQGAATTRLSFDGRENMTFAPHDPHPNPAGARAIAEDLAAFLEQLDRDDRGRTARHSELGS